MLLFVDDLQPLRIPLAGNSVRRQGYTLTDNQIGRGGCAYEQSAGLILVDQLQSGLVMYCASRFVAAWPAEFVGRFVSRGEHCCKYGPHRSGHAMMPRHHVLRLVTRAISQDYETILTFEQECWHATACSSLIQTRVQFPARALVELSDPWAANHSGPVFIIHLCAGFHPKSSRESPKSAPPGKQPRAAGQVVHRRTE